MRVAAGVAVPIGDAKAEADFLLSAQHEERAEPRCVCATVPGAPIPGRGRRAPAAFPFVHETRPTSAAPGR
jgi:hypothetical protein